MFTKQEIVDALELAIADHKSQRVVDWSFCEKLAAAIDVVEAAPEKKVVDGTKDH